MRSLWWIPIAQIGLRRFAVSTPITLSSVSGWVIAIKKPLLIHKRPRNGCCSWIRTNGLPRRYAMRLSRYWRAILAGIVAMRCRGWCDIWNAGGGAVDGILTTTCAFFGAIVRHGVV